MAVSRQDLICAIKDGDVTQVREVLTATGLDQEPDLKGHLLLVAIEEDQPCVVQLLCGNGLWSNVVRSDDLSPIHLACKYGNVNIIETLLRNGAGVNDQSPEHRITPILMAVRWRQRDAVLHLLDAGADPDLTSSKYSKLTSPLHEAAGTGQEDIVNLLLAAKADVNLLNGRRQVPLHLCCAHAHKGEESTGKQRILKRLLDCGSTVNAVDMDGNCPLHLAIHQANEDGNTQVIHALCVVGAHLGAYNGDGETPLHMAVTRSPLSPVDRRVDIVNVLLNFGADVSRTNKEGHTPLLTAFLHNFSLPLIELLINAGSDINYQDDSYETIFHWCAKTCGMDKSVLYLLRQGVDYNTVSRKKLSPLSSACISRHKPTIRALCQEAVGLLNPATVNDDVSGRPLNYAVKLQDLQLLEYLLSAGYRWTRQEVLYILEWICPQGDIKGLLRQLVENPDVKTLSVTCRDVLRFHIKDKVWEKVRLLPLPQRIKEQLMLLDLPW